MRQTLANLRVDEKIKPCVIQRRALLYIFLLLELVIVA